MATSTSKTGLQLVLEPPMTTHRNEDENPLWALILGWSIMWVVAIALFTLFAWKVVIPWLVHG